MEYASAIAFRVWQKSLNELQGQKEILNKQLAKLEAELEVKLEASGKFDLSWLFGKNNEIKAELKNIIEEGNVFFEEIYLK